jgi:hypothetical protein
MPVGGSPPAGISIQMARRRQKSIMLDRSCRAFETNYRHTHDEA